MPLRKLVRWIRSHNLVARYDPNQNRIVIHIPIRYRDGTVGTNLVTVRDMNGARDALGY